MNRTLLVLIAAAAACDVEAPLTLDQTSEALEARPPNDVAGVHWARDAAPGRQAGGSPNLLYHGGPVMSSGAYVEAIYWGPSWGNSAFVDDKSTGLQSFYGG